MPCAKSNRITGLITLAMFSALLFCGGSETALAQEPPTAIPAGGPPAYDSNAMTFGRWLLYPSVNFLAQNSNNFFLSSANTQIHGWEFGVTPSVTGVWSDGINTTTVYGNVQRLEYPTDNLFNSTNGEGTFTQQYAPLRDLNFTFSADYLHQTLQGALTNSIPNSVPFTGFQDLGNGLQVQPGGAIKDTATGQIVGQLPPGVSATPLQVINPYDQYTATGKVQKLFSDGIVTLGASISRTNYVNAEEGGVPNSNFTNKTYSEDAAYWLGSVFYFYTDGNFNTRTTESLTGPSTDSTAYRIIGGLGTRQFGLFRTSAYFGHQGSTSPGSGTSPSSSQGGNVFGGTLSYYPTPAWTFSLNVDETINLAPANAVPSTQAIVIPGITPLQIALSNSTKITSASLRSTYEINLQWSLIGTFAYTHVDNIGSPIWDNSYFFDGQVTYNMWRNLTLSWEYQYSNIVSNAPGGTVARNLGLMSATYKF
jgi:hypothetical protein